MQTWLALVEEQRAANEEAARLAEMITVLKSTHGLDALRLKELTLEWTTVNDRAKALDAELRAVEAKE